MPYLPLTIVLTADYDCASYLERTLKSLKEAMTNKASFPKAIVQFGYEYHELSWESMYGQK